MPAKATPASTAAFTDSMLNVSPPTASENAAIAPPKSSNLPVKSPIESMSSILDTTLPKVVIDPYMPAKATPASTAPLMASVSNPFPVTFPENAAIASPKGSNLSVKSPMESISSREPTTLPKVVIDPYMPPKATPASTAAFTDSVSNSFPLTTSEKSTMASPKGTNLLLSSLIPSTSNILATTLSKLVKESFIEAKATPALTAEVIAEEFIPVTLLEKAHIASPKGSNLSVRFSMLSIPRRPLTTLWKLLSESFIDAKAIPASVDAFIASTSKSSPLTVSEKSTIASAKGTICSPNFPRLFPPVNQLTTPVRLPTELSISAKAFPASTAV